MFFKKKEYVIGNSLSKLAWKKLLKSDIGLSSLGFIVIATLIAILGYMITPDSTPNANNQILEIASLKPGNHAKMLLITKNNQVAKRGMFKKMLFGNPNKFEEIPFSSYQFIHDKIILKEYSPESLLDLQEIEINIVDVIYPIIKESIKYDSISSQVSFTTIDLEHSLLSIKILQQKIIDDYLIERSFLLGTDRYGRDYLSRLMIGARVSLSVGFISVSIALIIGVFLGSLAGFFRSWIDNLIVWFINVVWSIPTLLLVIAITFALGKGFWQVFIAVGLTMWVEIARIVRGQILSIREKEFVEAGRALGFKNTRIIIQHILPNITSPIIVISTANFAAAILIEAGLSFLGIGVQPPIPSWGSMIKENYAYIILDSAYLAILPGLAIMLMVLAFMLLGNALRKSLDVKTVSN
ncbi:MAG: ABC transporter permease [Bacteroidetes bacterium]|nr:ABC transporter permease [Bacteroidota bacterium]